MRVQSAICALMASITGILVFVGCTSLRNEVNPSLLGVEPPKLVVTCFLSPQDTVLTVKVTRSNTVVGDSISLLQTGNSVTDATVTLSDGSKSVVLPYNNLSIGDTVKNQPYYSVSARLLPIVVGRTYTLNVVTASKQRVTSTCTIPAPVEPSEIKLDTSTRRYAIRVRWQDPVSQVNYYQVTGLFRYIMSDCRVCQMDSYNSLSFDDDNRGLFTDAGVDGTIMVSGRAYLTSSSTTNFYSQYRTASVTVNLMSVDQAYYQFQEAIIRQRRSRNNPFAEPVLIPSNINGGLGCFAGYTNSTITSRIK